MELLINLLERKNLCFKSFYKLCADFIDEISKGETQNLEQFQKRRQGLIKVLEQLEFEVAHWLESLDQNRNDVESIASKESKAKVNALLREKDGIVKSILDLDLQILGHIDRLKDETIQKLQAIQTGRKTITAYRSPMDSVESAEHKAILDREA